jgi:hypothetical protein
MGRILLESGSSDTRVMNALALASFNPVERING